MVSLCVCPSARPSVHLPHIVVFRSYARCTKCKEFKRISDEKWKQHEIEHARRRGNALLCLVCKGNGSTKRSPNPFKCEGCKELLGRDQFDANTLKNAKKRGDLLVCMPCQKRERGILDTLTRVDASCCWCSSTWRHSETCGFLKKTQLRVCQRDLEWLVFGPKNRVPRVLELDYYRAVSLLVE